MVPEINILARAEFEDIWWCCDNTESLRSQIYKLSKYGQQLGNRKYANHERLLVFSRSINKYSMLRNNFLFNESCVRIKLKI